MKLVVAFFLVCLLALVTGAQAINYVNYPDAGSAVWLSDSLIRFQTNLRTQTNMYEAYVVAPDGTGLRPATADEATAQPGSATALSPDGTLRILGQLVGWTYADGHTLYVAPNRRLIRAGSRDPDSLHPGLIDAQRADRSLL